MVSNKYKFERIEEQLESAKGTATGAISEAERQRENLAKWARDSDNRQLSAPTASDNRIRLRSMIRALSDIEFALDDISTQSAEQAAKKANFYKRIRELEDKRYEIDKTNNLDGKEDFARDVIQLVDDMEEWRQEMEEEQT